MHRALATFAFAGAAAFISACSTDTALLLRIDSDLRVPEELNGVRIRIDSDVKTLLDRTFSLSTQEDIPATLTVIAENDSEVSLTITVDGLHNTAAVAETAVRAAFAKERTVEVDIFLKGGSAPLDDGGTDAAQDGGKDGGQGDAGADATPEAGLDSGGDSKSDTGADAGMPDNGVENDSGDFDASGVSDASDAGVAVDTGPGDAGGADTGVGALIGLPCDSDAGCAQGLACLTEEVPGGYCTSFCEGSGCPENATCLNGFVPDANFCARTCSGNSDCDFRPEFACVHLSGPDASICGPGPGDDGADSGADASVDAGACPRVELTMVAPTTGKVGVGQTATFTANYFDATCARDPAAIFTWLAVDGCVTFADNTVGAATGEFIQPACMVYASTQNVTGTAIVSVEAVVTTFSGSGIEGFQDGDAVTARFGTMNTGAKTRNGDLYVVDLWTGDPSRQKLRKIDSAGNVTTIWNHERKGCQDGDFSTFSYESIDDIAVAQDGSDYYFSDRICNSIRMISFDTVTTILGTAPGYADGPLNSAKINSPTKLFALGGGLYFFDSNNFAIRLINFTQSSVSTIAGSGVQGHKDGPVANSWINLTSGLFYLNGPGLLFSENIINEFYGTFGYLRVTDGGIVTTLGGSDSCIFKDGFLAEATVCNIGQFSQDRSGLIYTNDFFRHSIRRIDLAESRISTVAGNGDPAFAEGLGSDARFFHPTKLFEDSFRTSLLVLDSFNRRIRKIQVER